MNFRYFAADFNKILALVQIYSEQYAERRGASLLLERSRHIRISL